MLCCPQCKNLNVVDVKSADGTLSYSYCRNCNWTSDGTEAPRLVGNPADRRK